MREKEMKSEREKNEWENIVKRLKCALERVRDLNRTERKKKKN
jgi:hypothetical protein